ncbi:MAG: (2Fe-2S)-binding protein [Burkholderiales bacterium]|nr:(2Fe-2S)-binding protein [Burkholderiales bacterium]
MIVCVCNNVSDREISQAVELGAATMDDLQRDLGVATCCGQCHSCAKQVLQSALTQPSAAAIAPSRHRSFAMMLA